MTANKLQVRRTKPLRIAIFTLESLANAHAVRRLVAERVEQIAFVGLSNPYRSAAGGLIGQTLRHLRRSGPRFLPFLVVNFALPGLLGDLRGLLPGNAPPERTPLPRLCRRLGVPAILVDDVNGAEMHEALRRHGVDLIVSYHFDQIFNAATLAVPPRGGVNVHPSLLPRHRGPVPTLYAALETPPAFGVTVHRLVEAIDAGAILAQTEVALPDGISVLGAARLLHDEGLHLLGDVLEQIEAGQLAGRTVTPLPYCPFPSPALLREASRQGVALADWRDFVAALRTAF